MQLMLTLDREAMPSRLTELDKRFLKTTRNNMLVMATGDGCAFSLQESRVTTAVVVNSLYAVITGAYNFKPASVGKIMADFGAGCFLEMCGDLTSAMNLQGNINPRDIVIISGGVEQLQTQLVLTQDKGVNKLSDMMRESRALDMQDHFIFLKLLKSVNKGYNMKPMEDIKGLALYDASNNILDVDNLPEAEYIPIKIGIELLQNARTHAVVVLDSDNVPKESIDVLIEMATLLGNVTVLVIHAGADVQYSSCKAVSF